MFRVITGHIKVISIFLMFCISASYKLAKYHKVVVKHSNDTGSVANSLALSDHSDI